MLVFASNGGHGEYKCESCQSNGRLDTAWIRERGRAAFGEPARHPPPFPRVRVDLASRAWPSCLRRTRRGARPVRALQPVLWPSARGRAAPDAAASLSPRARATPLFPLLAIAKLARTPCRLRQRPRTFGFVARARIFQVVDEAARAEIRAAAAALVAPDRWWAGRVRTAVHIVRNDRKIPGRSLANDAPLRAAFAAAGVTRWETCCDWASSGAAREGIEKIARADVVIGMHGAGLSHCLWMREGAVVVEAHLSGGSCTRSPSPFSLSLAFSRSLARSLAFSHLLLARMRARSPAISCSSPIYPCSPSR